MKYSNSFPNDTFIRIKEKIKNKMNKNIFFILFVTAKYIKINSIIKLYVIALSMLHKKQKGLIKAIKKR